MRCVSNQASILPFIFHFIVTQSSSFQTGFKWKLPVSSLSCSRSNSPQKWNSICIFAHFCLTFGRKSFAVQLNCEYTSSVKTHITGIVVSWLVGQARSIFSSMRKYVCLCSYHTQALTLFLYLCFCWDDVILCLICKCTFYYYFISLFIQFYYILVEIYRVFGAFI